MATMKKQNDTDIFSEDGERLLSLVEAGVRVDVSRQAILQAIQTGRLRGVQKRMGNGKNFWFVRESDLSQELFPGSGNRIDRVA